MFAADQTGSSTRSPRDAPGIEYLHSSTTFLFLLYTASQSSTQSAARQLAMRRCHRNRARPASPAEDVSMFRQLAILSLVAALSSVSAPAQTSSSTSSLANLPSNTPVAYVYVASSPGSGVPNVVNGYSAAANGALTPIAGSPFPQNIHSMAVNGKYLMATDSGNPPNIDTFQIGSDGSLTYVTQTSCAQTGNGCVAAVNLIL